MITLRTVTLDAPCRWCSSRTTSSAVVPAAARRASSHVSAGVASGSWSRSRCSNCTAKVVDNWTLSSSGSTVASGCGFASAGAEQPVRDVVSLLPDGSPARDQLGCAPQVLDQHDPQRDGDRPQLADRQRLHALIGRHELAQQVRVEAAVGVRDECPRQPEHARIARQRAVGQLRQLPVVAGRHVVADLADLGLDDVVVVDEPFRRRRDGAARRDGLGDGAVRVAAAPGGCRAVARLSGRTATGRVVTVCAAARLAACCSSRSALKISARMTSANSKADSRSAPSDVAEDGPHQLVARGMGAVRRPAVAPFVRNTTSQNALVTP